jgi:asparagine synthase (glutamine-hydrolysing)
MSGIVAIMSLDGRPIPPELPRAQLAAIAHRGEWEPRLWEAPGIALGHVNLPRTPEAEREFLPAPDLTGRYWLTWDGRLDNRDELARKLGYDSAQGAEKTDADYVLDAFVNWGDDCVHHLLGDWAVVIWDNQARRLFCAKDPIGWRQLYYAEHDGLLAVGSEPQQFFANGWLPRVVREEYLLRYLAGAPQQAGEMWLVGITELSGGRSMCQGASAKTAPTKTFYRVNRARGPKSIDEAIDGVDFHLDRAVKARLRSNRPVGVMLSGGLRFRRWTSVATRGPLQANSDCGASRLT